MRTQAGNAQQIHTNTHTHNQKNNDKQNLHSHTHTQDDQKVSFGFTNVSENDKEQKVKDVFDSVAHRYDLMNDLMSFGVHRWWKKQFVNMIDAPQSGSLRVLDIAGGTGDIAIQLYTHLHTGTTTCENTLDRNVEIVVSDINEEMLKLGKQRAELAGIDDMQWIVANGESMPFDDNSFDVVTIAFGIRNFTHIDAGLKEAFRVLKPGGRFLCLEFSKVDNCVLNSVYDAYSFWIIPTIGQVVTKDRASYQYLVESIRRFPCQSDFATMLCEAGFSRVSYTNLTFGVTAIHSGFKI